MKTETLDKLNAALDALWSEDVYGVEHARLIRALQITIEKETSHRLEVLRHERAS